MPRNTFKSCRRAFTTVELMTVVGILVVLIAIGVAVLASMRANAKRTATRLLLENMMAISEEYRVAIGRNVTYDLGSVGDVYDESIVEFVKTTRNAGDIGTMYRGLSEETMVDDVTDGWVVLDPWKTRLLYLPRHPYDIDDNGSDDTLSGVKIHNRPFFVSAGEDMTFGTGDDIYSFEQD